MTKILSIVLVSLFSVTAFAAGGEGAKVGLSLFKYDYSTEGPNLGDNEVTNTFYDLKLGYLMSNKIYVGFIYSSKNTDSGAAEDKRLAYGATLGYHSDGWFGDFSYFLSAEREFGGTELEKGTGIGLDFGYNTMVGSNFFVGGQLSYRSITYTEANGASVDNKEKSEMYPMFNFGVMF